MLIGKVVGSVVSTRKSEKLIGNKFMIIELAEKMSQGSSQMIAIDNIGAGIGSDMENAPVDAAIVGIIDDGRQWM